jgi:hypothetical protein
MDRPQASTEIDGVEYTTTVMGGERALELIFRAGQILGPAIDLLGPLFKSSGKLADINVEALAPAIGKLFMGLTPEVSRALLREGLLAETFAVVTDASGKRKQLALSSKVSIDNHFAGKLDCYMRLIAWSFKTHLGSFTSVLSSLAPGLRAAGITA